MSAVAAAHGIQLEGRRLALLCQLVENHVVGRLSPVFLVARIGCFNEPLLALSCWRGGAGLLLPRQLMEKRVVGRLGRGEWNESHGPVERTGSAAGGAYRHWASWWHQGGLTRGHAISRTRPVSPVGSVDVKCL